MGNFENSGMVWGIVRVVVWYGDCEGNCMVWGL